MIHDLSLSGSFIVHLEHSEYVSIGVHASQRLNQIRMILIYYCLLAKLYLNLGHRDERCFNENKPEC